MTISTNSAMETNNTIPTLVTTIVDHRLSTDIYFKIQIYHEAAYSLYLACPRMYYIRATFLCFLKS